VTVEETAAAHICDGETVEDDSCVQDMQDG
jgi:hypothetical protein